MKVLYALANYPQASESYIEAEINYVRSVGVEVEAWSYMSGHGDEPPIRVHRCPFEQAVQLFKPDLIHVHYLVTALDVLQRGPAIPATVRAHSFDWSVQAAGRVSGLPQVRWIFAFPHFAREAAAAGLKKVLPMKVAYDAPLYDAPLDGERNPTRVVRLSAGRRVKGLNDFMQVARLCKREAKFELAVCPVSGDEAYLYNELRQQGVRDGVTVWESLGRQDATRLIRTSAIYLDTSDPNGHPFGMPISIAEALASGAVVLARESKAAAEYLGAHGLLYRDVAEAALMVKMALSADAPARILNGQLEWARQFRSDVVLPALVEKWREILGRK